MNGYQSIVITKCQNVTITSQGKSESNRDCIFINKGDWYV